MGVFNYRQGTVIIKIIVQMLIHILLSVWPQNGSSLYDRFCVYVEVIERD